MGSARLLLGMVGRCVHVKCFADETALKILVFQQSHIYRTVEKKTENVTSYGLAHHTTKTYNQM